MEVCGGQTHTIVRFGIDELLPPGVTLVHGPGCPVCVTPVELIDQALAIARAARRASSARSATCCGCRAARGPAHGQGRGRRRARGLLAARRAGPGPPTPRQAGRVLRVGFETTAPANAMAVLAGEARRLANFSLLVSHVLVPPAMEAILASPRNRCRASSRPATSAP